MEANAPPIAERPNRRVRSSSFSRRKTHSMDALVGSTGMASPVLEPADLVEGPLNAFRRAFAGAVQPRGLRVQKPRGQPQLEDVGAPVGEVEERVEVLLHPRVFVAFEVAP